MNNEQIKQLALETTEPTAKKVLAQDVREIPDMSWKERAEILEILNYPKLL